LFRTERCYTPQGDGDHGKDQEPPSAPRLGRVIVSGSHNRPSFRAGTVGPWAERVGTLPPPNHTTATLAPRFSSNRWPGDLSPHDILWGWTNPHPRPPARRPAWEGRREASQLVQVPRAQTLEPGGRVRVNGDAPRAGRWHRGAHDQPGRLGPVHELHRAVDERSMSTSAISPIVGPRSSPWPRTRATTMWAGSVRGRGLLLTPVQEPAQLRTNPRQLAITPRHQSSRESRHRASSRPGGCVRRGA